MTAIQKKFCLAALAAVCAALYGAGFVDCSADIMKQITKGYVVAFEECQKEMDIQDDVMKEMMNFWNHDYALVNREVGCVIICMAKKHNLVGADGKHHTENVEEFVKKHGADDTMAKKLIEIVHGCEKAHEGVADDCARVLEMAKCFRDKVKESGWSPNFQELIDEMMAEARG